MVLKNNPVCAICKINYYVSYEVHCKFYHMNKVIDHLYIGNSTTAECLSELKYEKIDCIVNAADELKNYFPSQFKYYKLRWSDNIKFKAIDDFDKVASYINEQILLGHNVLVHCQTGRSRSATAICAYLIKYHDMNVETSIKLLKDARPIAHPNSGFTNQLIDFYQSISEVGWPTSDDNIILRSNF